MGKNDNQDKFRQNMTIIAKRVTGNKIMYHLQVGKETQWVSYDDMVDYLDLVIEYEKNRKCRIQGLNKIKKHNASEKQINIEID